MAGLSGQERAVIDDLVARELPVVRADDLVTSYDITRKAANQVLGRLHRKGWLRRIKRGVYVVVPLGASSPDPPIEDAWLVAHELFSPCYVSGWSAAEYWDLTEQIFNSISVVSARAQRRSLQTIGGVTFHVRVTTASRIFGTKQVWLGSRRVHIADPHRLIIDILDDPKLGGGGRHTLDIVQSYWTSKHAKPTCLLDYAQRFRRGTVFKQIGLTAERFGDVQDDWLEECRRHISAGISLLDPSGPNKGPLITRWNLRLNLPIGES